MDPLSDLITVLQPRTVLSKPISGSGQWGVGYPAYGKPGYALVLEGSCWLTIEGRNPVRLEAGDFVLLPATPAFELSSRPGLACIAGQPSAQPVHHGDPTLAPDIRILGGSFELDRTNASLLGELLPEMLHLRPGEIDTAGLSRVAQMIVDESNADRPGADMILERLLEIMLVQTLRDQAIGSESARLGMLAGLRDPGVAKALRALHADPRRRWTVAGLASIAGMSRSAFAARFRALVGHGPIDYLIRWRMTVAKAALGRVRTSLERIATEVGYDSASAYSTAFRREVGCPPRAFARSMALAG